MNKMIEITSSRNPLIKEIKSLYRKKERWNSKTFIIEGIKIIEEAIENNYPLKNIIVSDQLLDNAEGQQIFKRIKDDENLVKVSESIFKEISDTENPQGILGVARFGLRDIDEIENYDNPFLLLLDQVQDPGNMGTIIRTGDGFNIDGIIITEGCVDPYNPKVVRSTMGSIFRVPLYKVPNGINALHSIKERGIRGYSTSLEGSIPIYNVDFKEGFVLIIGNESKGVDKRLSTGADTLIKIPMPGKAESLNAAVASSIIMYEAMKQRINIS